MPLDIPRHETLPIQFPKLFCVIMARDRASITDLQRPQAAASLVAAYLQPGNEVT